MQEAKKSLVERLFVEQRGALQAFLFRRVRKHPEAAELAQEAYVRMLRAPDIENIRNPEAYLYAVASNLAKEHAHREPKESRRLDIDDPLVQEQLAEMPGIVSELDTEQRIRRLREVLAAAVAEMPRGRRATVLARLALRGDRAAARHLHPHGQEVPEPGFGALPPPHGAAGVVK